MRNFDEEKDEALAELADCEYNLEIVTNADRQDELRDRIQELEAEIDSLEKEEQRKPAIAEAQLTAPTMEQIHELYCVRTGCEGTLEASWPDNCYAVACALVDLFGGNMVPQYGMWDGIDQRQRSKTYHRHGWAVCDGIIYDPTRWVFEKAEPYLFIAHQDDAKEYDVGATKLRDSVPGRNTPPDRDADNPGGKGPFDFVWDDAHAVHLHSLFGDGRDLTSLTWPECFWLANQAPDAIKPVMTELYYHLACHGLSAMIPWDYREYHNDMVAGKV